MQKNSGLGICDVVCIVLVILKLFNVINLAWVWVLAPIWIFLLIYAGCNILIGLLTFASEKIEIWKLKRKREEQIERQQKLNQQILDEIFNGEQ